MDWDLYDAVLFDLDGVVTPTAEVHMHAWAAMFTAFLAERSAADGVSHPPYTDQDYFDFVDGKPRYDGVRSFLASRGITLPEGTPDDPPTAQTVCGLGNSKNVAFEQILAEEGVVPYPGSVTLIRQLHEQRKPMAVVSSSRNAPAVLAAAGLTDYFGLVVPRRPGCRARPPGQARARHVHPRGGGARRHERPVRRARGRHQRRGRPATPAPSGW